MKKVYIRLKYEYKRYKCDKHWWIDCIFFHWKIYIWFFSFFNNWKFFFSFLFQFTRHCLFLARIQYCPASRRHKVNLGCRGAAQDIPSLTTEVWSFLVWKIYFFLLFFNLSSQIKIANKENELAFQNKCYMQGQETWLMFCGSYTLYQVKQT